MRRAREVFACESLAIGDGARSNRRGARVHSGTALFGNRGVRFWHATRIPQDRPGDSLGIRSVDRWHRRERRFGGELDRAGENRHRPADRDDVAVERSSPNHVREHSGGTPMTGPGALVVDTEADIRWRDWQARGAEGDRRTARRMRGLMLVIVAGLLMWFVVQLT